MSYLCRSANNAGSRVTSRGESLATRELDLGCLYGSRQYCQGSTDMYGRIWKPLSTYLTILLTIGDGRGR